MVDFRVAQVTKHHFDVFQDGELIGRLRTDFEHAQRAYTLDGRQMSSTDREPLIRWLIREKAKTGPERMQERLDVRSPWDTPKLRG